MACNCTTNPCGCDVGIELPYLTGATGPQGSAGADGADGADAGGVVDATFTGSIAAATATPAVLGTITVPANTMSTDEDMLQFYIYFTADDSTDSENVYVSIGGQGFALDTSEAFAKLPKVGDAGYSMQGRIIRDSATTAQCSTFTYNRYLSAGNGLTAGPTAGDVRINQHNISVDWSQANIFEIGISTEIGYTAAVGNLAIEDLVVTYLKRM